LQVTNFWWEYDFSHGSEISYYACFGIALGVLNALLPMQLINEKVFPMKEEAIHIKSYSEAEE
jgi:hypothetical protein